MLSIALTGGIGSGKTTVCKLFNEIAMHQAEHYIINIVDADLIARDLLSGSLDGKNSSILTHIKHYFGSELFNELYLERAKLRQLIFSSPEKKQQLESLLHPLVYQEISAKIKAYAQQELKTNKKYILIVAIPLLLETQSKIKFDRILVIDSSIKLQILRTSKRDHCSQALIEKIIHTQVDRKTRLDAADDIIINSGNLDSLYQQVEQLFQSYTTLCRQK